MASRHPGSHAASTCTPRGVAQRPSHPRETSHESLNTGTGVTKSSVSVGAGPTSTRVPGAARLGAGCSVRAWFFSGPGSAR